jgi:hypothetical protein
MTAASEARVCSFMNGAFVVNIGAANDGRQRSAGRV